MFKITSTRPISWDWASFALVKGDNVFPSRKSVPQELWPKLKRFRDIGILAFELEEGKPVGDDQVVLAELTEQQLYQLTKDELVELAKANSVDVKAADESVGVKKKDLLDALCARLPKPAPPQEGVSVDPTGGGKVVVTNKRGGKGAGGGEPASPVTVE